MNRFPPEHCATIIQMPRTATRPDALAHADWDLLFHAVTARLAALAAEPDAALQPTLRNVLLECVADLQQLHALRADAAARRSRIDRVLSDLRSTTLWARPPMPRAPFALEPA